jgi:phosphoribosylformylglycinamidine synthase subunit PurS
MNLISSRRKQRLTLRRSSRKRNRLSTVLTLIQHKTTKSASISSEKMKAKIKITPKKAVLDPQGNAVKNALIQMGYEGIDGVRVGKYLEIELSEGASEEVVQKIDEACYRFLSNPVIEDYQLEVE